MPNGADEEAEDDDEDGAGKPTVERKAISRKVRAKLQRRGGPPKTRNSNKQREKRRNQEAANEYSAP